MLLSMFLFCVDYYYNIRISHCTPEKMSSLLQAQESRVLSFNTDHKSKLFL